MILDGCKDYSDVKVEVTPYRFISISPNAQKTINLSNYAIGQYTVVLIVDGQIIDSKNLIKN